MAVLVNGLPFYTLPRTLLPIPSFRSAALTTPLSGTADEAHVAP